MSLRIFLARTGNGWTVMPGGFARIGKAGDASATTIQRGGAAADVWIIGQEPVEADTMAGPTPQSRPRLQPPVLASRAAENLFWLGRYSERAEGTMRLLRAWHTRLAENSYSPTPLREWLQDYLVLFGIDVDQPIGHSLLAPLAAASTCASRVRDGFSVDAWAAIQDLSKTTRRFAAVLAPGADAAHALSVLLRKVAGISGLIHENMYRFTSWRFLALGRSIERASSMASLLAKMAAPERPEGALDVAIEVGDSVMTHRRRFAIATERSTVIDLLALDPMNPRSILFQLNEIHDQISALRGSNGSVTLSALDHVVTGARNAIAIRAPDDFTTSHLDDIRISILHISDLIGEAYWS